MLKYLPAGDVMIHCGVITHKGAEDEVRDFITGDHDLCLWVAEVLWMSSSVVYIMC